MPLQMKAQLMSIFLVDECHGTMAENEINNLIDKVTRSQPTMHSMTISYAE
jgi:hypothetical protein